MRSTAGDPSRVGDRSHRTTGRGNVVQQRKERPDMTFNHRRISTMRAVTLSTAIVPMTLAVVAGGQSPAVREGNCELAEQLFPNHNPGLEA
jgi:hypothetical protein